MNQWRFEVILCLEITDEFERVDYKTSISFFFSHLKNLIVKNCLNYFLRFPALKMKKWISIFLEDIRARLAKLVLHQKHRVWVVIYQYLVQLFNPYPGFSKETDKPVMYWTHIKIWRIKLWPVVWAIPSTFVSLSIWHTVLDEKIELPHYHLSLSHLHTRVNESSGNFTLKRYFMHTRSLATLR